MDINKYAVKLPAVILGTLGIINLVKGTSDAAKKAAILQAIPLSVSLAEYGVGADFINDPALAKLIEALVDAEQAVLKAREALKEGVLNKHKANPV